MALIDVLAAATVRPVFCAWFDIKDVPLRGWTGPGILVPTGTGDDEFDDYTYDSAEGVVSVSDIVDNQGIGNEVTITFAVSEDIQGFIVGESLIGSAFLGNPGGPVYDEIIIDRRAFLGRKAVIWLAFLTEDDSGILPEVERVFSGVMVACQMSRQTPGQPTLVTLTCDQDTQFAQMAPARLMDHQFFNTADTATSYLNNLVRGPIAGSSLPGGSSPGGGGGSKLPPARPRPGPSPLR